MSWGGGSQTSGGGGGIPNIPKGFGGGWGPQTPWGRPQKVLGGGGSQTSWGKIPKGFGGGRGEGRPQKVLGGGFDPSPCPPRSVQIHLGHPRAELLGRSWYRLLHPEDLGHVARQHLRLGQRPPLWGAPLMSPFPPPPVPMGCPTDVPLPTPPPFLWGAPLMSPFAPPCSYGVPH